MKKFVKFVKEIFMNFFPKSNFKNKIICYYYNHTLNDVRVVFQKGYFKLNFENGISVKSYYPETCQEIIALKGFFLNYELKPGDVFIDGGAYVGLFTIYASKKVGRRGKVIAFEPHPSNYEKLQKGIKLNDLKNVILISKGIWSENTISEFDISSEVGASFFYRHKKRNKLIKVPLVKLDTELEKLGIKKVDFIKMDVEGSEIKAIKGMENTLKNNKINLAIASYHIVNGEKTYVQLEKILYRLGYEAYTAYPQHLTTYAKKEVKK